MTEYYKIFRMIVHTGKNIQSMLSDQTLIMYVINHKHVKFQTLLVVQCP
jgi:hypothetical protein